MIALAAVAGVALAAVGFVAARGPVIRRMAGRNAVRRKGETALVVLGAMLGTAIITGSLLVGDTLGASIRSSVPDQLGPVDLVVNSASPESAAAAADAVASLDSADIDGTLPLTAVGASVTGVGEDRRAQPNAQLLEVDFPAAAEFGGDPAATGISGPTPRDGEVVLGADLADELQVGPGDRVEAYAYGETLDLAVDRIVPRTGVAGFWQGFESRSMNAFVAPGTVAGLYAATDPALAPSAAPPSQLTLVSATGDVEAGAARTGAVTAQLDDALAGIPGVEVDPVKQSLLDAAEEEGDAFGQLFLGIGSFAVLAGILLLVNIFVMLAEERKSELGMLRAVGLTRRNLVGALVVEGALYSLGAAAVGALAGIGVGRAIILVTEGIFASFADVTLRFTAEPSSIATGFLVGLLISLATVLGTSVRISRINIIRAVRDLPEPVAPVRRWWAAVLAAVVAVGAGALSAGAIAAEEPFGTLLYPSAALVGAGVLAARFLPRRAVVSAVGALVVGWGLFFNRLVDVIDADILLFVAQGIVLTFAAVVLLSQNQELVGGLLRRLGGDGSLVTRLGLAYPLARRFRTGMTLAMYSLVVFTLVFIAVLSQTFGDQVDGVVEAESGGFDVLATTSPANPLAPAAVEEVPGVAAVATLTSGYAEFATPARPDPQPWGMAGFDETFVAQGPPALDRWDRDAYGDEDAVWDAVLADPSLVVADAYFLQSGGPEARTVEVGDTLTVVDPASGAESERTVAAVSAAGLTTSGVLASQESVAEALSLTVPDRFYVAGDGSVDAPDLAADLQGRFVANGVQADSFSEIAEEATQVNLQFFQLMQGYLALGLLVGIAGLGVIMVRAVRERRRQIGMLRSLGLQARTVRSAFLLESGFIALEGIVLGAVLALVTGYQVIVNGGAFGDVDVAFRIPWVQLAVLATTALVASLAATAAPARRAARIRPAVALRIAD